MRLSATDLMLLVVDEPSVMQRVYLLAPSAPHVRPQTQSAISIGMTIDGSACYALSLKTDY